MILLNGRFCNDKDNFTVISTSEKSVVNHALVQVKQFKKFGKFEEKTVLDVLESFFSIALEYSMPDHSLICWEYMCPELPPNLTPAQPSTGVQPKPITHSKKYRWNPNKTLFRCGISVNTLEKLWNKLDHLDTVATPKSEVTNCSIISQHSIL